jgi:hypothetical protein
VIRCIATLPEAIAVIPQRISESLNIALDSLGETVSGLHAYLEASQITETDFKRLNEVAFRLENGLLRLIKSLERKQIKGDWTDHLLVKESTR